MTASFGLIHRAASVAVIAAAMIFVGSCNSGGSGSSDTICHEAPDEIIGLEILCPGDSVSGPLNSRSNPHIAYGFKAPKNQDYQITLSAFGNPSHDFDLYALSLVGQSTYRLIQASETEDAAQEDVIVELGNNDVIRIEIEFNGLLDQDQSYQLSIVEI